MLGELISIVNIAAMWTIPLIIAVVPLYAMIKKVSIYETFIEGAKEGFGIAVSIIPYLVAILVAIGMFRASGAIELLSQVFSPVLKLVGMPAEVLPLAIIRPLSGSGALGIMSDIASHHGGDSYLAKVAAVMTGSSETTFYVLTVYFGSVGIQKFRHAPIVGLIADISGMLAALFICRLIF